MIQEIVLPNENECPCNSIYELFLKNNKNTSSKNAAKTLTNNFSMTKEMSLMPTKTPVSVLQEFLSRKGSTPKYELVQIEGAIHEPTFRYRVTVADTVALGTGRSKKVAKHEAAKNILKKLAEKASYEENNANQKAITPNTDIGFNQIATSYNKISGNPIGTLQEMCISRKWPPPAYEMTSEEGLPHERQFTIACIVFKYREIGSGKSKKLAKRQAAYKMWEKLQECPPDQSVNGNTIEAIELNEMTINRYSEVMNSKISSSFMSLQSLKVPTFHLSLKQNTGVKLQQLQNAPLRYHNFDAIQVLQDIAVEQKFEVTYVDIEEISITGQYQCLVQLSTLPVAVCHGTGKTAKDAQYAAAINALEYLKIMNKK